MYVWEWVYGCMYVCTVCMGIGMCMYVCMCSVCVYGNGDMYEVYVLCVRVYVVYELMYVCMGICMYVCVVYVYCMYVCIYGH